MQCLYTRCENAVHGPVLVQKMYQNRCKPALDQLWQEEQRTVSVWTLLLVAIHKCSVVMCLIGSVCVCVCLPVCLSCSGSNFWKPWLRNLIFGMFPSECLGQFRISRSSDQGQGQGYRSKKCVCVSCSGSNFWMLWPTNFIFGTQSNKVMQAWLNTLTGGLPLMERQLHYYYYHHCFLSFFQI